MISEPDKVHHQGRVVTDSTSFVETSKLKYDQWHTQSLVVVGAHEKWGSGRGVPSRWGRVWGGGCAPPQNFLDVF